MTIETGHAVHVHVHLDEPLRIQPSLGDPIAATTITVTWRNVHAARANVSGTAYRKDGTPGRQPRSAWVEPDLLPADLWAEIEQARNAEIVNLYNRYAAQEAQ